MARATHTIAALRRNLQSWCLGFEALRKQSHEKVQRIWNQPRTLNAELGQNAAGGAQPHKVKRQSGSRCPDRVVARSGTTRFSRGHSWMGRRRQDRGRAALAGRRTGQPTRTLGGAIRSPCFTLGRVRNRCEAIPRGPLYEISGVRHPDHWSRRLDYLFKRPITEGPVLTVFFDGMNQEPSVPWLPLLKALQGEAFAGRVRVMTSTWNHHFADKLSRLRGLVVSAVPLAVEVYDAAPGGELDQLLVFEGLTQAALHPDLVELARTPRLFKLVVKFRDKLVDAGQVTIHRLLWEYGRDTFGNRAGKSFSETEWREWLKEIAKRYRDGVQEFSLRTLGETASRPDLSEKEVYARLSDIIDGQFAGHARRGLTHQPRAPALRASAAGGATGSARLSVGRSLARPGRSHQDVVVAKGETPQLNYLCKHILRQEPKNFKAAVESIVAYPTKI
jgi:hypothetical protein